MIQTFTTQNTQPIRPHICIVGGGFGGLYTALYLQKYRHLRRSRITLIEPKERFLFTPMMYELITNELKEWEIAPTYSSLIAGTSISWQQTSASAIDLARQTVTTSQGETLTYDYLVVANGAESRPVNIPGVQEHALTFRSLEDSQRLKVRLDQMVRSLSFENPLKNPRMPIPVTIIGGGASGVELAGKVSDYLGDRAQITLIESGPTILKAFATGLRRLAQRALARRKISVLTETLVTNVTAKTLTLRQGNTEQVIPSQLTLWAVGTQPRPWLGEGVPENDYGQRLTRRSLQLISHDNVFVLGDSADVRGRHHQPAPNTAQAAFQAANRVAANLAALTQGKSPKPFNYLHLGDMITLGIGDAGLWSFGITLGGRLAALSRRGVYIFRMPTRRHQVKVARRALSESLNFLKANSI